MLHFCQYHNVMVVFQEFAINSIWTLSCQGKVTDIHNVKFSIPSVTEFKSIEVDNDVMTFVQWYEHSLKLGMEWYQWYCWEGQGSLDRSYVLPVFRCHSFDVIIPFVRWFLERPSRILLKMSESSFQNFKLNSKRIWKSFYKIWEWHCHSTNWKLIWVLCCPTIPTLS